MKKRVDELVELRERMAGMRGLLNRVAGYMGVDVGGSPEEVDARLDAELTKRIVAVFVEDTERARGEVAGRVCMEFLPKGCDGRLSRVEMMDHMEEPF